VNNTGTQEAFNNELAAKHQLYLAASRAY